MEDDKTFLKTMNPPQRMRYRLKAANCDVASFNRPFQTSVYYVPILFFFFLAILE